MAHSECAACRGTRCGARPQSSGHNNNYWGGDCEISDDHQHRDEDDSPGFRGRVRGRASVRRQRLNRLRQRVVEQAGGAGGPDGRTAGHSCGSGMRSGDVRGLSFDV